MILEAGKLSAGKSSPIQYINGILSNWKNLEIFTIEALSNKENTQINNQQNSQEEYNKVYERRRFEAVFNAQKNNDTAMSISGMPEVLSRLSAIEKDLAFAEISNNSALLLELEEEQVTLTKKANELLANYNLTLDDLTPKYLCSKCNDTGYVGTHRCDCFNLKSN